MNETKKHGRFLSAAQPWNTIITAPIHPSLTWTRRATPYKEGLQNDQGTLNQTLSTCTCLKTGYVPFPAFPHTREHASITYTPLSLLYPSTLTLHPHCSPSTYFLPLYPETLPTLQPHNTPKLLSNGLLTNPALPSSKLGHSFHYAPSLSSTFS